MKKYHKIMIEPVLNGILVSVGCQKAVYTDIEALIRDFAEYLHAPEQMSKHYSDRSWSIEVPELGAAAAEPGYHPLGSIGGRVR